MDHQVKSVNTDSRSRKRLKFTSSKQRSKRASADVYRSYKRRIGVTSAASREERVHHTHREESKQKKQKLDNKPEEEDVTEATFSEELDLAYARNPSEIFRNLYHQVWPLARSLPEVLHHAAAIVNLLLAYVMSHPSEPHQQSHTTSTHNNDKKKKERFIVNHATTDVLHLLAVLAKDLRHEIHPFLHTLIIPRIVNDILNQPTTTTTSSNNSNDVEPTQNSKQIMPVDVSIIEASFRCISYIFRYDAEAILTETTTSSKNDKKQEEPCLELLRQYYGSTLAHRRDIVRRLAAETFAPLIRKLKQDSARKKHLRRVIKAFMSTQANNTSTTATATATTAVVKLQTNAIDGISHLFFEVARGVAGQGHSKGKVALRVLLGVLSANDANKSNTNSLELAHSVTAAFLDKMGSHLQRPFFGDAILQDIIDSTQRVLKQSDNNNNSKDNFAPKEHMIRLLLQIILLRDGFLLEKQQQWQDQGKIFNTRGEIVKIVLRVMDALVPVFAEMPLSLQSIVLSLVSSTWKTIPTDAHFAKKMRPHIESLVKTEITTNEDNNNHPALVLAQDLMPFLPSKAAMGIVATSILTAAAAHCTDRDLCLSMIVAAATSSPVTTSIDGGESDNDESVSTNSNQAEDTLFSFQVATQCQISHDTKQTLLEACLLDVHGSEWSRLGVAARCVSFVALTGVKQEEEQNAKHLKDTFDKVSKWLSIEFHTQHTTTTKSIQKTLRNAQEASERFLHSQSTSLWTLKAVAAYVQAMQMFQVVLGDREKVFDALVPNLSSSSHFRRLYSLQILASFPKKPFVTDHADLDLTDDLDEEPSEFVPQEGTSTRGAVRSGLCDILDTLLSIESSTVAFENERPLLSLISRIEILGRSAKLPVVYAEAAANHMLGLLYIKFSPIWPAAVSAYVSLANGQEFSSWSPLKEKLDILMNTFPNPQSLAISDSDGDTRLKRFDPSCHQTLCATWDESNGENASLFGNETSQHLPTDEATVLQHVWSVLENASEVVAKNSRKIVPIFLQFMHSQFYSYYPHDPDAKELRIEDHIEDTKKLDRALLKGHVVHQRLISILKVFAAVSGPTQLYKHSLLLSMYTSLLSQETKTAQLAFDCIKSYKLPFMTFFSENVGTLFAKGGLREGLLKFTTSLETRTIDNKHRRQLVPFLMRVLFGRLSARSGGSRSSKDSPSARRAAVLSFIAVLCKSDEELYPLIYLMIRNYVPTSFLLLPVEQQDESARNKVLFNVKDISFDELALLPMQVHIGFLHLLEPVIHQLGHRVVKYVDQFTTVILRLCKFAEVKQVASSDDDAGLEDSPVEEEDGESKSKGVGPIRTLCFRRLSEMFAQFSSTVDFSAYESVLWSSIERSVAMLPATVVRCAKVPALLSLLQTLSSHRPLLPILSMHKDAVPCVIKCLADTSSHPVVDATLTFIDNLLNADDGDSASADLISGHIPLILKQFTLRLGDRASRSATWRRELRILCRITELVEEGGTSDALIEGSKNDIADKLCTLLMPYLGHGNGATEGDQLNVLKILEKLIRQVNREAGLVFYEQFSRLLGPGPKGKPGIASYPVRNGICSALSHTPLESMAEAKKVTSVLTNLCKTHPKRVDEMDYDVVIPSLNALDHTESGASWRALTSTDGGASPKLIAPLVGTCFHYLFNDDGVIARGAFKSLKGLIGVAAGLAGLKSVDGEEPNASESDLWIDLLEKTLVPAVRNGLTTRNAAVRRLYILLMAEVARSCRNSLKPNLYGDLAVLIRDDEPDLDFFANITHLQMHRRTRAFQRLRKALSGSEDERETPFSLQSLSNVLLPLALHPVYESKTKAEETFAVEAIATVGAISRHLSWSKYSTLLWTSLTQFDRHPEQERYLVGMICALIDGFHFDIAIVDSRSDNGAQLEQGDNAVWRALEKRFIPRIETLLSKEKVDHRSGSKTKTLRASLILALVKLFKRFSKDIFEARLPRLLTVICDGLKSRESDARDVARNTLAKVAVDVSIEYLPDILRELTLALKDGFRLHVRIATVHSILLEIAKFYKPPPQCTNDEATSLPFDRSVPAIMDIVQQDLFGGAQERKDAEGVQGRFVKEAAGSKSHNVIELTASLIMFRPSLVIPNDSVSFSLSSIHAVVSPLVERLKPSSVDIATIRRVKECLSRVVTGLGKNPSVSVKEVLPFVYATAAPFIGDTDFISAITDDPEDSSDEDEPMKAIQVSGGTAKERTKKTSDVENTGSVAHWRPSTLKSSKTSKDASKVRLKESQDLRRVQDGVSAPKLTGSARYAAAVGKSRINDPANISAVVFSLRLLYSTLKKHRVAASEEGLIALVDPFVPLLTACVCTCRETDVVLLALRCLGIFLVFDLPSKESCAAALGTKTLELLGSNGVGTNQNSEMSQACFKMLFLLINLDQSTAGTMVTTADMIQRGEEFLSTNQRMPLDSEQMKVLMSFLQESLMDSESHNSATALIKAILSRRFISPEFYDLMDSILELAVRSPKAPLRQHCAGIVVNYLLNYPLGEDRLESHLKQIVLNLKYEYEEGRLSGISLATLVVEKVPVAVLQKYVQLFFLPLTMQLVNDDSEECRKGVAKCLSKLFQRLPMDIVQSLYDYTVRWSHGNDELQRASLQLFGIIADTRSDLLKRGETVPQLLDRLKCLVAKRHNSDQSDWQVFYFSFLCIEKLIQPFPKLLTERPDLWEVIVRCLAHSHSFIKLVTSRLIHQHLESLDPVSFANGRVETFLTQTDGSLYEVARNLCFQLNSEEEHQSDEITTLCIKSLCWLLPAMHANPTLCYASDQGDAPSESQNPVGWVMKRLSGMAKPKGPKRRQAVFKAFGAFATVCPDVVFPHLELMLEPLHRVDTETANDAENPSVLTKQHQRNRRKGTEPEAIPAEASLARDVLRVLEDKCDPADIFLTTYAAVKTKAREKKESRKLMIQSEAIRDPQSAAKRRRKKNEREQQRKKRKVEDRRQKHGRGGTAKKSRYHGQS
ncbi:processome component 20 homolog [Seminavis robusta]|uniref:Processome component 20 homolog n=1 Tax=Seminavis robusta TaxID=568900 RepID=A0A9N8DS74_9STRA|nr:processome component 20 homolog [Seminavis robusta]|eukprot:Sro215_g088910.1 processome component 20 homolog (2967) ;mRNA; r:7173-16351